MPRGILERGGHAILAAVQRGLDVAEEHLPRFPRAPKWDREEDFDSRVSKLKAVRDAAAARLNLDPGVLCSRERLESIARKKPTHVGISRMCPACVSGRSRDGRAVRQRFARLRGTTASL